MDQLLYFDKELFLWLNSLGSNRFDWIWMMFTHHAANFVVYLIVILLIIYKNSLKTAIYLVLFVGLLILFTDQLTNIVKVQVGRLRPCYDTEIQLLLRLVKPTCGGRYSFFSAHASNSFALAIFFGGIVKPYFKYFPHLLVLIASLIAYSRVYIGVHFPLDIFCGSIIGGVIGFLFYKTLIKFNFLILKQIDI